MQVRTYQGKDLGRQNRPIVESASRGRLRQAEASRQVPPKNNDNYFNLLGSGIAYTRPDRTEHPMELEESPEVYKVTDYDELLFSQVRGYFRRSERRRPSCVACPTSGSEELLFDAQKLCDEFQIDVIALQEKRLRQRWNEEFSATPSAPASRDSCPPGAASATRTTR